MAGKKNMEAEDLEIEQMSRTELARLQRQHRIMEGDREAYSEEMKILLQKQRKTIETLEKEKADLIYKLNHAKCPGNETQIEKMSKKLKNLLLLYEKLKNDLNREKSQVKEFDLQIRKVDGEFNNVKMKSKGKTTSREAMEAQERIQLQLENKLDVITVKLNRLTASNQELRHQIDHFLKERSLYNKSHRELGSRFEAGKKIIMDLMEQSTLAYDQREEAQGKLEGLRQKGKQDLLIHGQEIKELQRKLDHDSKLEEFLAVKGQKRIAADLEAKEALKRQEQKEALEGKIQHYWSLLEKIREVSGETDVDKLSAQFLKREEENFALFNYVNELNNEKETVQEQLNEIKKDVEEHRILSEEKLLKKNAAAKTLEAELSRNKSQIQTIQEKLIKYHATNDVLLQRIGSLIRILEFEDNALLLLLGNNVPVTSFNFSLYLGIVEKGVAQFRTLYNDWLEYSKQLKQKISHLTDLTQCCRGQEILTVAKAVKAVAILLSPAVSLLFSKVRNLFIHV